MNDPMMVQIVKMCTFKTEQKSHHSFVEKSGEGINMNIFCWPCNTTSHSTTPHPMNRARSWYTVDTLLYDLCIGLAIFDFTWEG